MTILVQHLFEYFLNFSLETTNQVEKNLHCLKHKLISSRIKLKENLINSVFSYEFGNMPSCINILNEIQIIGGNLFNDFAI